MTKQYICQNLEMSSTDFLWGYVLLTVSASLHYASWIDYAPPKMCAFYSNFAHSIQIFLNRTRKFAQNLNWIRPKKSFWKIEYAHCNDADTVPTYFFWLWKNSWYNVIWEDWDFESDTAITCKYIFNPLQSYIFIWGISVTFYKGQKMEK